MLAVAVCGVIILIWYVLKLGKEKKELQRKLDEEDDS